MYMCVTMPAYAIGCVVFLLTTLGIDVSPARRFFVTIILRGMGWSVKDSLLLVRGFSCSRYLILANENSDRTERAPLCFCCTS